MPGVRSLAAVLLLPVTLLAGCQTADSPNATPPPAASSPDPTPTAAASGGFTNPVFDSNFPDPMIIQGSAGYLAIATNGNGSNVQTLTSKDLVSWESGPDAMPKLPGWSSPGKVWAPEAIKHSAGRYLMYYTTRSPNPNVQCIGAAVANKPEGPYVDQRSKPLICQENEGGSIDPSPFTASDGTRYLYWKNDGNALGVDTYIYVQRLAPGGTELTGKAQRLFKQDLPWEGTLVEGPFLWENGGRFQMFYSANDYGSENYAVGHAVADSPLGPFTKTPEPILVTNDVAAGPGHCALFEKDGRVWMVYHAWTPGQIGEDYPGRAMWLSEVTFNADDTVTVVPPTANYPSRP
jgi:beta-xylosidase